MIDSKDAERDPRPKQAQLNYLSTQIEPELNWKQVTGCFFANSICLAAGFSMAYTSALFPALLAPDSEIPSTPEDCAWLGKYFQKNLSIMVLQFFIKYLLSPASSGSLSAPVGALIGGFLMEHIGRLRTLQIATLPYCIAWIITATAQNFAALLFGRILVGAAYNIGITAASVLITETALKKYRGVYIGSGLATHAFGTLCGYTLGAFLDWRTLAWISMLSPIIAFVLPCIFTAESPLWLRSRGHMEHAQKVSLYYYQDPDYVVQPVVLQSPTDRDGANLDQTQSIRPNFSQQLWRLVTLPSGFKPLIILNVLFLFLSLSGIVIILMYGVTFLQEAGIGIDPYYATITIGVSRFIASIVAVFLIRSCSRRVLMLVSTVGMAVSMAASAYTTALTQKSGSSSYILSWFPVACIITYHLAATIGLQTIPFTMASELFPQRVRGAAQAVNMVMSELFTFASLLAYPWMISTMGGAVGVQYFFASVSIVAAVFTWIFCPETHAKSLSEIEEYFTKNTMYLGHKEQQKTSIKTSF